jgi:hypothetical protein
LAAEAVDSVTVEVGAGSAEDGGSAEEESQCC